MPCLILTNIRLDQFRYSANIGYHANIIESLEYQTMSQQLLKQLEIGEVKFADVLAFIDAAYQHHATAFKNGLQHNAATENQGSAKVLSFAKIQGLDPAQTLSLFAEHYQSVLATPTATDHQNIRQFMLNGWEGVEFEGEALTAK